MKSMSGLCLSLLCVVIVSVSCIRDKILPCPPLELRLEVTDKNYANIRAAVRLGLKEERAEDLPFRDYVSTLYYRLTNVATGETVVERELSAVEEADEVLTIPVAEDLPFGRYVLTAWGNVTDTTPLDDFRTRLQLHPNGLPGEDVYLASDTILYDETRYSYTVGMKRTKGKLIVQTQEMPDYFGSSLMTVSNIHEEVDHRFVYAGAQTLRLSQVWPQPVSTVLKSLVAPSDGAGATTFTLRTYEGTATEGDVWLEAEPVQGTLNRNELTILRYVYDPCCCRFKIYILVNDNWETLHSMEII